MKIYLPGFLKRLRKQDRGTAIVMVTVFVVALFGFAALSIDVGNVLREQRKAHTGTDAGALAGVAKVGNVFLPTETMKTNAIAEARVLANTNGVTDAEISAGARGDYPGAIQVGTWNGSAFLADQEPYNAVRVPARRTVGLDFGKVVGLGAMTPGVASVAVIGSFSVPMGVPSNYVGNVGTTNTFRNWNGLSGSGNWGPIQLCDGEAHGANDWESMIFSAQCFAYVGMEAEVSTGNTTGIWRGFDDRWNDPSLRTFVIPVIDDFPNGSSGPATVVDFALVRMTRAPYNISGGGGKAVDIEILGRGMGSLGAYAKRVLVQ